MMILEVPAGPALNQIRPYPGVRDGAASRPRRPFLFPLNYFPPAAPQSQPNVAAA